MKGPFVGVLLLCGLATPAVAQINPGPEPSTAQPNEFNLQLFVEELFQFQDEDVDYEDLYEALFQYYRRPLNLNRARREDLQALFILTEKQISSLLAYRAELGDLVSVYELQAVPDLDPATLHRLLPFVTVAERADTRSLWQRIREEDNHYVISRYERTLETRRGYLPPDTNADGSLRSHYLGSPDKLYTRYRLAHTRDFSLGFTVEKDPGEQWAWDASTRRYGFDFYSAHLLLQEKGRLKSLALGDYQLQFGQGLVLASGFAIGKGSETVATVRRSPLGVRPYTSVLEFGFFRGGAATYEVVPGLELTGFYSRQRLDGNVQLLADSLEEGLAFVSSLPATGLHRTPNEVANKSQIGEHLGGGHLQYRNPARTLTVGASALYQRYDLPLRRNLRLYNQFEFNAQQNHNLAVDVSYVWRNFNFFGEGARSASGGTGLVTGLLGSLSRQVEVALVFRDYARDFHAPYGQAFGERTRNQNERGLYWGLKVRPTDKWVLSAYYDRFRFPWLSFRADAPAGGQEYLVRLLYAPQRNVQLYGQFRAEQKERNLRDSPGPLRQLAEQRRRHYWLVLNYAPDRNFSLSSRVQCSDFGQEGQPTTRGYALIQDITYGRERWRLSGRYALFDTDDFENRQYAFEKDVLFAFSIPAYSGRGIRAYLLAQYRLAPRTDIWVRLAQTSFRDRDAVGSGLERIEGRQRTDLKVQVRQRF